MKKLLTSIALIFFIFIGVYSQNYADKEIVEGSIGKITWTLDISTGTLSFSSNGNKNTLSINGYDNAPWSDYKDIITIIVIGDGITSVDDGVFNDLPMVSIVIFNNDKGQGGVPEIGGNNFEDSDMENVVVVVPDDTSSDELDDLISDLGGEVSGDNVIKEDVSDEVVGEIGSGSDNVIDLGIYKCGDHLNSIYRADSLKVIGTGAMYDYDENNLAPWHGKNITNVTVDNKVTRVGNYAFIGCDGLQSVVFNSNSEIGENAIPSGATKHLIIHDKQQMLLNSNSYDRIEYARSYNNTNWQALYLPCTVSYESWCDNFDIARINNVHQYDDDNDGTFDRTTIEIIYITAGFLQANTPYFIKAKNVGTQTITLQSQNVSPIDNNDIWCASTNDIYTFIGTYSGVESAEMSGGDCYGMSAGTLISMANATNNLSPLRWYLKISSKDGSSSFSTPTRIRIQEIGGVTGINDTITEETEKGVYYDLSGRRVEIPSHGGIYIVNNKKIIIR